MNFTEPLAERFKNYYNYYKGIVYIRLPNITARHTFDSRLSLFNAAYILT